MRIINSLFIMQVPFVDWLLKPFNLDLPDLASQDAYLDYILPIVAPYSEDLQETDIYVEKSWIEVRDDEQFLDAVLHIFKEGGKGLEIKGRGEDQGPDYLRAIDGNVIKGTWTFLKGESARTFLIKTPSSYELFEKEFINADFFILKKHGYKHKAGKRKYFFMARESMVGELEWREVIDLLYNVHRYRFQFMLMVLGVAGLVFLVLLFSLI